jgi:cytochrome c-type biogenesis protein CcmH/NrfG
MSEWGLIIILVLFTVLAALVLVYPLQRNRLLSATLFVSILGFTAFGYIYWGSFDKWSEYALQIKSRALAAEMLATIKKPEDLINKLKAKLDDTPHSAKGLYLLGRLYMSQNQIQPAVEAFAKAYHFKPDNEQFAVNYAQSLWELNKKQFSAESRGILTKLLDKNPNQPDALAMLAMDAYMHHANKVAISYWERLLKLVPSQSKEAEILRKAIVKAQG